MQSLRCPRVRDRIGEGKERIRLSSTIVPPYTRRSKSLEVLIPILYLKGISTGDFEEALIAQPEKVSRQVYVFRNSPHRVAASHPS